MTIKLELLPFNVPNYAIVKMPPTKLINRPALAGQTQEIKNATILD